MPGIGSSILILLWRSLRMSNKYLASSVVIPEQVARRGLVPTFPSRTSPRPRIGAVAPVF